MFLSLSSIHSELAKAGRTELQTRVEHMARERDATLTQAQEMSDRLVEVEQEKNNLQVCVGPVQYCGVCVYAMYMYCMCIGQCVTSPWDETFRLYPIALTLCTM